MGKEERFDLPEFDGGPLNLEATSGLLSLDWARDIVQEPATVPVLTAGALVSSESELPPDHLVSHKASPSPSLEQPVDAKIALLPNVQTVLTRLV